MRFGRSISGLVFCLVWLASCAEPDDDRMREAILNGEDSAEIERLACEAGMTSLVEVGLRKAARGITTLEDFRDLMTSIAS